MVAARPLRPIEDGLNYHVIDRGNNRQKAFVKPGDFVAFLKALGDIKQRKPFRLCGNSTQTSIAAGQRAKSPHEQCVSSWSTIT